MKYSQEFVTAWKRDHNCGIYIPQLLSVREKLVRKQSPGNVNVFSWSLFPKAYLKPINNPVLCILVKWWSLGSAVERVSVPSLPSTVFIFPVLPLTFSFYPIVIFLLVIKGQILKVLSFPILIKIHRNQVLKQ